MDLIVALGSPINIKDIIFYTLNGLPPSYQGFKIAIHRNLHLLSLNDLYFLLCSEEIIQASEVASQDPTTQTTLITNHDRGRVGSPSIISSH